MIADTYYTDPVLLHSMPPGAAIYGDLVSELAKVRVKLTHLTHLVNSKKKKNTASFPKHSDCQESLIRSCYA